MNPRRPSFGLNLALTTADTVGLLGCLLLTLTLYDGEMPTRENFALVLLLAPVAVMVLQLSGAYEGLAIGSLLQWCRKGMVALFVLISIVLGFAYALKVSENYPRMVLGPWTVATAIVFIINRTIIHAVIVWRHRHGLGVEKAVVIGPHKNCVKMARHFAEYPELGIVVAAYCITGNGDVIENTDRPITTLDDLGETVEIHKANRVIVCAAFGDEKLALEVTHRMMRYPVTVQYAPDLSAMPIFCMRSSDYAGQLVINLSASPMSDVALAIKWLEDKVVASAILIAIAPVLIVVALLVKLSSPGPVFFTQKRHGIGGKVIHVFKFRTMFVTNPAASPLVANAGPAVTAREVETRAHRRRQTSEFDLQVLPEKGERISLADDASGAVLIVRKRPESDEFVPSDFKQATSNDPRITPIGRILRKTSLDELPQFFNVLMGDMSIVGPRPHAIQHNNQFTDTISNLMRRHYVKPGITGLAQIHGARGETRTVGDMRRRIRYDLEYIRNWSLWLDLKIISMTCLFGFFNRQP
jgi:exopolysaccharide biosynthesis polyprenyl glycosylphosphotransferase